ncbi:MAG: hypothetical protein QNJ90_10610 [Planctomycetota bacterium]|nr:hypothetical protein [Planctomycetota bacterium]
MDKRCWMLTAGCAALLLVAAGCVSDDVVYVDEQGNELSVDESGQPLPPVEQDTVVLDTPTAPAAELDAPQPIEPPPVVIAPAQPKPTRPAATQPSAPKPTPTWDGPPAGAAPSPLDGPPPAAPKRGATSLPPAKAPTPAVPKMGPVKKPKKKIDSSAGLDLPPAG